MATPLKRPWVTRQDLNVFLTIASLSFAAAIWPRWWDRRLMRWRTAISLQLMPGKLARLVNLMRHVLGASAAGRDLLTDARDHYRMCQETAWIRIRNMSAASSTEEVEVEGLHHVQDALAKGH